MADLFSFPTCFRAFNAVGKHTLGGGVTTSFLRAGTLDTQFLTLTSAQNTQYPGQIALQVSARAHVNTADEDITITLFKNGRATNIVLTIPAGSTALVQNTQLTEQFVNGDTIDYQVEAPAGSGAADIAASLDVDSSIINPQSGRPFEVQQGACFNRMTFAALLVGGGAQVTAYASTGNATVPASNAPSRWKHEFPGAKAARLRINPIANTLDQDATVTVLIGGDDINLRNAARMQVVVPAGSLLPVEESAASLDFRQPNPRPSFSDVVTGTPADDNVELTNRTTLRVNELVGSWLKWVETGEVRKITANTADDISVSPAFSGTPSVGDSVQVVESLEAIPVKTLPVFSDVVAGTPSLTNIEARDRTKMTVNDQAGRFLKNLRTGEVRKIVSNTNDDMTVSPAFSQLAVVGDTFEVSRHEQPSDNIILPVDVQGVVPAASGSAIFGITVSVFQG